MANEITINPITGRLDVIGQSASDIVSDGLLYLKLDQTTPQTVLNDAPNFSKGIIIKTGEKLIFDGA